MIKKTNDRAYYTFALKIIGDFGVSIAAPVVLFVLVGQYLDGSMVKVLYSRFWVLCLRRLFPLELYIAKPSATEQNIRNWGKQKIAMKMIKSFELPNK